MKGLGQLAVALLFGGLGGLVVPLPEAVQSETHTFKGGWQKHVQELGTDMTYRAGWSIEVPSPTHLPRAVSIKVKSRYLYKYVVFNLTALPLEFGFLQPGWSTSVCLQGVGFDPDLVDLDSLRVHVGPYDDFWGPGRPKASKTSVLKETLQGVWWDPMKETWTIQVEAASWFGFSFSGPAVFTQVVKQRVVGSITYWY